MRFTIKSHVSAGSLDPFIISAESHTQICSVSNSAKGVVANERSILGGAQGDVPSSVNTTGLPWEFPIGMIERNVSQASSLGETTRSGIKEWQASL